MCGIYGFIQSKSKKKPLDTCLEGLRKLQYRGYDSAGVASIHKGAVLSFKTVGKVELLKSLIHKEEYALSSASAHTRWATHGGLSENNAHPQIDYKNSLALVHNGIIENYLEIKEFLQKKGINCRSETDTETAANLISYFCDKMSISNALKASMKIIKGSFALVLVHKDAEDTIFAGARNCPLVIGICDKTSDVYVSSDPSSFSSSSYITYYLENDEIAKIKQHSLTIYDDTGKKKEKLSSPLIVKETSTEKGGYDHYMIKEIHEQSFLCREILKKRTRDSTFLFSELLKDEEVIKTCKHIEIIACGSSYHAGLITKGFLEELLEIPVSISLASEYRYCKHLKKTHTICIVISQSGETADTLAALRCQKDTFDLTIALCNVENSTLTREIDRFIPLYVGKEVSVCSTKAFTSQLLNLYLLGIHFSNVLGIDNQDYITELRNIPYAVDDTLYKEQKIKEKAEIFSTFPYFFFIGRQTMYPVSMEAALKLKEISYLPAEALAAGEMKHGPIALIDEKIATIAFLGEEATAEKTLSNLSEIKARNGRILIFSSEKYPHVTDDVITLYKNGTNRFAAISYCIAGQIFSYYLAKKLGREIDFPRNLAKSVTVE